MNKDELVLSEESRSKLDGIVQKMIANKESDENIQFVVGDFKSKYGEKKNSPTNTSLPNLQEQPRPQSKPLQTSGAENKQAIDKRMAQPITLGDESKQMGIAKSEQIQPSREEKLIQADLTTDQNIVKTATKGLTDKTVSQTAKEKALALKTKMVNYLKKLVSEPPPQGEGEPMITEQDNTPIDIYAPIKMEVDELQPNQIKEDGVDPQLRERVVMDFAKKAQLATKDFEQMKPTLETIKTVSQAKELLGKTSNEINQLVSEVQQGKQDIDKDVATIREKNKVALAELGLGESFVRGIEQTTQANSMYDAILSNNDEKIIEIGEKAYLDQMLYGDQQRSMVAETLGGQVKPLTNSFLAAVLSAGNPLVAGGVGTASYARLGGGSEAMQVYSEARAQGATPYEAMLKAREASASGFTAGGLEGVLGTSTQVGGTVAKLLNVNKRFAKSLLNGMSEAGVDALGAMGAQYYNNVNAKAQGIERAEMEGVAEQGAAEAAFSAGFNILFGVSGKLTPKTYKTLVNEFGKLPTVITQTAVDQAVKDGFINKTQAEETLKDVLASSKAQQKLEAIEIPEKEIDNVIDLQKQLDVLEAQKKDASPAALPAIEGKIEALSAQIQIKAAIPLTSKERTELNKLQAAKDSNADYDKVRLKELEARQASSMKAIKEADEVAQRLELAELKKVQESKREIELSVDPIIKQENLEENLGKTVSVNNKTGVLTKEGESRYVVEGDGFIVEINDESVVVDKTPTPKEKKTATLVDNKVEIDGTSYGLVSINKDKNDKVVSLTLKKDNGQNITIRDEDLALDIAIAQKEQSLGIKPIKAEPTIQEEAVVESKVEPVVTPTDTKVEAVQTPTETVTEEVVTPIAPDGGEVAVETKGETPVSNPLADVDATFEADLLDSKNSVEEKKKSAKNKMIENNIIDNGGYSLISRVLDKIDGISVNNIFDLAKRIAKLDNKQVLTEHIAEAIQYEVGRIEGGKDAFSLSIEDAKDTLLNWSEDAEPANKSRMDEIGIVGKSYRERINKLKVAKKQYQKLNDKGKSLLKIFLNRYNDTILEDAKLSTDEYLQVLLDITKGSDEVDIAENIQNTIRLIEDKEAIELQKLPPVKDPLKNKDNTEEALKRFSSKQLSEIPLYNRSAIVKMIDAQIKKSNQALLYILFPEIYGLPTKVSTIRLNKDGGVDLLDKGEKKISGKKLSKDEFIDIALQVGNNQSSVGAYFISEAYHKAKADGTNPELVQAVEELLGKNDVVNEGVSEGVNDGVTEPKVEAPKEEATETPKTKLQTAKEKLAEAKRKRDELAKKKDNLGAFQDGFDDAKEQAEVDRDVFDAYVEVAKEYISEVGGTIQDLAKEIGEEVNDNLQLAWDVANGKQQPPPREKKVAEIKGDGVKKTVLTYRVYEGEIRDDVRKEIEKYGLDRLEIPHQEAENIAKKLIEEVGLDLAYQATINGDITGGTAAEIYAAKIRDLNNQLNSAQTQEEIERLGKDVAAIYNKFSNVATEAGQFGSQLGHIYDRDRDLGYNYEKKVKEYKDANNGEISPEIAAKFKDLDEQIKALSKQVKEAEAKVEQAREQQAFDDIKASIKRNPSDNKRVRAKRLMSEGLDDIAQALGVQLMASGTKRASVVTGLTKIGQSLILNGEATIENVGEKVREFVKAKFGDKFNFDDFATDFDLAMLPEESSNKLRIPNSYIRDLVEGGIDNIDDLVKVIQKDYSGTEREIRDAITGYGKIVNQSKDEVSVQLRKMKDIGRLISAIEDVENKKRPLKSGFQRDKLSEEQRRLRKELREAMKNLPIDVDTQNNQLKTALDAAKSKVRNKIEELQKDIQTGERVEKNKRTVEADQELLELKQQRDELQEIHDNMFGGNELTYQEKIDIAIKSTEKSIAEYERRISENDLEPKKGEQLVPTKELKELQDKKSDLQKELNKLREAAKPQKTQAEIDEEKLNRAIEQKTKTRDELKDKLLKQDTSVKTRTPQSYDNDPKVKALNQEIEALNDAMQKLRDAKKIKKTQEQKALDIIERQIKDIDEKIKNGQLVASAKAKMSTPALEAARKRLEQKRLQLKNIKETADFLEQKRLENTKKSTQRRITELQEKLRVGDFDKKPKKLLIEDTELTKLRAEKIRLQDEYDKEIQKAKLRNRTKAEVWKDRFWEGWGITRALSATGEWSFVGVQGLTQLIANPKNSAKAFGNAWRMMWSEKAAQDFLDNLRAQDFYPILKQSKLAITEPNAKITAREELFNSQWTNIAWGVLGSPLKLKSEGAYEGWLKLNPFKALERASVGYLDTIRVLRFLDGVQMLEMKKKNFNEHQQAYKDMADVVNTLTGRASIGGMERFSEELSRIFFSPRNWASGLKTTILLPIQVARWQMDSGLKELSVANKIALGDLSKMMGLTTAMVMLVAAGLESDDDEETSVGTDPTSSDFGKIIIGDRRIDPWGGKIQQIVFASRMYLDSITKKGVTKNLGQDAFTATKFDLSVQQATNKLSPSAKLLVNYMMSGRDKEGVRWLYGEEYTFKNELAEVMRPIYLNTVLELLKDDPKALDGMLLFYGFFGGGIGIQEDKPQKQSSKKQQSTDMPL